MKELSSKESSSERHESYVFYYVITTLMALIASPLLVQLFAIIFGMFGASGLGFAGSFALSMVPLIALWVFFASKIEMPSTFFKMLIPVFASCLYYLLVWAVPFGLGNYGWDTVNPWLDTLAVPFFITNTMLSIFGDIVWFPLTVLTMYMVITLTLVVRSKDRRKKLNSDLRIVPSMLAIVIVMGVIGYQIYDRSTMYLSLINYDDKVSEELNLDSYMPFSQDNQLEEFNGTPLSEISSDYPKIDGATAAYPVYGAMAQALYSGFPSRYVEEYIRCSTTEEAYERLIIGETDIFFGAQPSQQQIDAARNEGIEFTLTPIAREAFVFLVNKDNPVESLSLEEIREIYTKEITNWSEVGGNNEPITSFQRSQNSGSQTIMEAVVMEGVPLAAPLREDVAYQGMGQIVSEVASYRNNAAAIGYSFRYYATVMNPNPQIRLLAIDGIEPTLENIKSGSYPLCVEVYAVTTGNESENTKKLLDWILSAEGQSFIEQCGYTGISAYEHEQ